jgi:hypothetical protein
MEWRKMRKLLLSENVKKTDSLKYLRGYGTLTSKWILNSTWGVESIDFDYGGTPLLILQKHPNTAYCKVL